MSGSNITLTYNEIDQIISSTTCITSHALSGFRTNDVLCSIFYGAHVAIALFTLYALHHGKENPHRYKQIFYLLTIVIFGTINFIAFEQKQPKKSASAVVSGVTEGISQVYFPYSGARRYLCELLDSADFVEPSLWQDISALLSAHFRSHILFTIVWSKHKTITMVLLLFLGAQFGLGVVNVYFRSTGKAFQVPWAYWITSLALNVILGALIILRLLWMKAKVCSALGKTYGATYTGIAAMIFESSLLYTIVIIFGYLFLPGGGGTENMFSPVLAQTEFIASEFILLRVALGRAMSKETVATAMAEQQTLKPPTTARTMLPIFNPPGHLRFEERTWSISLCPSCDPWIAVGHPT